MHGLRSSVPRAAVALLLGSLLASLAPASTAAQDRAVIRVPFDARGAAAGALGWLGVRVTPEADGTLRGELDLFVLGLRSGREYALRMDGERRALLRAGPGGLLREVYRLGAGSGDGPRIAGDPREGTVAIGRPGGADLLVADLAGPLRGAGSLFDESASIPRTSLAPGGASATARVVLQPSTGFFSLILDALPAGRYDVDVEGVHRGEVAVGAGGRGQLYLSSLGFDPRGERIEVFGARGRLFRGPLRARLPGAASPEPPPPEPPPEPPPAPGPERLDLTVRIPDFESSRVEGVTVWRRDDGESGWSRAVRIVFLGEPGGAIDYRVLDAGTRDPLGPVRESSAERYGGGDGLGLTLVYQRRAPEARFKVSTFNAAGDSPRSHGTVRQ